MSSALIDDVQGQSFAARQAAQTTTTRAHVQQAWLRIQETARALAS